MKKPMILLTPTICLMKVLAIFFLQNLKKLVALAGTLGMDGFFLKEISQSSLYMMNLIPHEEFVVKVLEIRLVSCGNLIKFFKWVSNKLKFSVTIRSLYALVRAFCSELNEGKGDGEAQIPTLIFL